MGKLISKKTINYHSSEAQAADWVTLRIQRAILLNSAKRIMGGLWIGGSCELYDDRLIIRPNGMNASAHKNISEIEVPFEFVEGFDLEKRLTTSIVRINFAGTFIRFRCWGAEKFISKIQQVVGYTANS